MVNKEFVRNIIEKLIFNLRKNMLHLDQSHNLIFSILALKDSLSFQCVRVHSQKTCIGLKSIAVSINYSCQFLYIFHPGRKTAPIHIWRGTSHYKTYTGSFYCHIC